MESESEKQKNQAIENVSEPYSKDSLPLRQPENASGKNGLVSVVYVASWREFDKKTFEEIGFEQEEREWHKAGSELNTRLEDLRENAEGHGYSIFDCRVSLAEYAESELDEKNISEVKSLILRIFNNKKFYFNDTEEAVKSLLERCRIHRIPTPNEIVCVVNGYQIQWKFTKGFERSEISLWKFIQKKLHENFAKIGSDASICQDATAMLFVPGFSNSDFDLCEKITTVYSNDELCASPIEFIAELPVSISEIKEYRANKAENTKSASKKSRSEKKTNVQPVESPVELEITDRAKSWADTLVEALRYENSDVQEYRYYQYRIAGNSKKNYKWLEINGRGFLPKFDAESDSWISAATYYSRFRRRGNIAAINCNFLIINWSKSELGFTPTPEHGKELVLSRCRELGLPEPYITATPDGLEVKWYWQDRMTKILYEHDLFNSQFNKDWDVIQRRLFEKFWYLGADPKKLCVTVMFSIPGSKDTRKSLKSNDRIIREIHKGETVESYRNIQRILGIKETYCDERPDLYDELDRQKWEQFSIDNSELVKDWLVDVLKIHSSSKNWICFGFIDENRKWNNRWTRANELQKFLLRLIYRPEFNSCDFYVSQGEFFSRNNRHVDNLASINVSFVDLDYKELVKYRPEITENPSPEEWENLIKAHCQKFGIPLPNDVVFSGGGVHLKWIYDELASRVELPLWQYNQKLLLSQFRTLGADPAAVDAARVLRLVGTLNHKDSPIIKERVVHVIDREFFSGAKISLRELVKNLESSKPENPEEFNAVKSEWQRKLSQLSIKEANMLRPDSEIIDYDSEDYRKADGYYWLNSTLHHHHPRATYLAAEISGVTKWIETYHLHESLKMLYGTPNLKLSLSELKAQEREEKRDAIEWIPCNYVVLSRCPGETFDEQKKNIFIRCHEYREVGIPEPNQIIKIGSTLLVEWTYQSVLTWRALSRWQVTQEYLCHHFEDWGAMDDLEYLKATALLPVPGFVYDGETARLEYSDLSKRYTFNRLANAVLNFSQKEVKDYKEKKAAEKAKHKPARKIALPENVSEKIINTPQTAEGKSKYKNVEFRIMALMRYMDIIQYLELQRLENGEIPQNTRELCCFWALVCARQAGLVTTYEEFKVKAEELIRFCGLQFTGECTVKTLSSAFRKNYLVTTNKLIKILRITPEYQKHMKVLLVGVRATAKKHQSREEWLAEHTQEKEKPWEKLGVCRATYFNWKKAGKLPSQIEWPEEDNFAPVQVADAGKKHLDWCLYIMSAIYIDSLIRCCEIALRSQNQSFNRAFLVHQEGFSSIYSTLSLLLSLWGLLYCRNCRRFCVSRWKSFAFLKRRKGKRKRKRKR